VTVEENLDKGIALFQGKRVIAPQNMLIDLASLVVALRDAEEALQNVEERTGSAFGAAADRLEAVLERWTEDVPVGEDHETTTPEAAAQFERNRAGD
jgi:hypothetical protein